MKDIKVQDVMTHLVVTLRAHDSIQDAARMLEKNRISGAPVVDSGRLVGVVSEADLIKAYAPAARTTSRATVSPLMLLVRGTAPVAARELSVEDIMVKDVLTVKADDPVAVAASIIDRHGVRRLPVIDPDGYVIGIITRSDLVRAIVLERTSLVGRDSLLFRRVELSPGGAR